MNLRSKSQAARTFCERNPLRFRNAARSLSGGDIGIWLPSTAPTQSLKNGGKTAVVFNLVWWRSAFCWEFNKGFAGFRQKKGRHDTHMIVSVLHWGFRVSSLTNPRQPHKGKYQAALWYPYNECLWDLTFQPVKYIFANSYIDWEQYNASYDPAFSAPSRARGPERQLFLE